MEDEPPIFRKGLKSLFLPQFLSFIIILQILPIIQIADTKSLPVMKVKDEFSDSVNKTINFNFFTTHLEYPGISSFTKNKSAIKNLLSPSSSLSFANPIIQDIITEEDTEIKESEYQKSANVNRRSDANRSRRSIGDSSSGNDENNNNDNCTQASIDEFPGDGFTREQRRQGWILVHIILVFYGCWFLAAICDDYFVPVMEIFCISLNMGADVIGATLMAMATSSPELFVNCVGTFVTKGDIGIGTVVGSAVFNLLGVPACCGLFSQKSFPIHWWPITRDCFMYSIAVLELIIILSDGRIMWYEALILMLSYFIYITVICFNDTLCKKGRLVVSNFQRKSSKSILRHHSNKNSITESTPLLISSSSSASLASSSCELGIQEYNSNKNRDSGISLSCNEEDYADNPWMIRTDGNIIIFLLRWPITFILWATIPDCRKWPRLRYFTFFLCVIWIAIASYLVSFFTTIIGDTFDIPDSVMGITILAIGMSIPEAVSSLIVMKQGNCEMGICNSIGSNIFGILLCLGIPWFIKTYFLPTNFNENWILLNSSGLIYSVSSILIIIFGFYISFLLNKFQLNRNIGTLCLTMYVGFIIIAILIEMNYFLDMNLTFCQH